VFFTVKGLETRRGRVEGLLHDLVHVERDLGLRHVVELVAELAQEHLLDDAEAIRLGREGRETLGNLGRQQGQLVVVAVHVDLQTFGLLVDLVLEMRNLGIV